MSDIFLSIRKGITNLDNLKLNLLRLSYITSSLAQIDSISNGSITLQAVLCASLFNEVAGWGAGYPCSKPKDQCENSKRKDWTYKKTIGEFYYKSSVSFMCAIFGIKCNFDKILEGDELKTWKAYNKDNCSRKHCEKYYQRFCFSRCDEPKEKDYSLFLKSVNPAAWLEYCSGSCKTHIQTNSPAAKSKC